MLLHLIILTKYIKIIILSATSGDVSTTGIIKKLLSTIRIKKKKHDKILMLAKSKLNSIETLISQALNDMEISHEEFIIILKEKVKYERMKYIIESENEQNKITRLSNIYKFKDFIRKTQCIQVIIKWNHIV